MKVYLIANQINGKVYVGQTTQRLNFRWYRHRKEADYALKRTLKTRCPQAIHLAMAKYGKENFRITIIDEAISKEELSQKEIFWIKEFNSLSPNGYNLTTGGERGSPSDETKKRQSEAQKGSKTQAKTRPIVYLKDPEGQIWAIKSLNAFETKYGFVKRKLGDLIRNIRSYSCGWSKPTQKEIESASYFMYFTPFIEVNHYVSINKNKKICRLSEEGLIQRSRKLKAIWKKDSYRQKQELSRGKTYKITDPKGKTFTVKNLTSFCKKEGVKPAFMLRVASGERSQYKGWAISKLPNLNDNLEE